MAEHLAPDYELAETMEFESAEQFRALFEDTRLQIVDLLLERAATVTELGATLDKPKGTVAHHMAVLEDAGLVQVVRTKKVRAMVARYYGRTARTYLLTPRIDADLEVSPDYFLSSAATEYAKASQGFDGGDTDPAMLSTLRHSRIPRERAKEWAMRVGELAQEFASEPRGGDTTYGLLLALYPTDRPHLPDGEET
jgi:DNA-binding transcriptional ArsR family regulator